MAKVLLESKIFYWKPFMGRRIESLMVRLWSANCFRKFCSKHFPDNPIHPYRLCGKHLGYLTVLMNVALARKRGYIGLLTGILYSLRSHEEIIIDKTLFQT